MKYDQTEHLKLLAIKPDRRSRRQQADLDKLAKLAQQARNRRALKRVGGQK